jgi:hypothetical protein
MAPNPRNLAGAAQRANNIVALLEYKPSPGIYSRLERAVQQLPENVRVQELPGLLKRYKDGIPGWEVKAVDLDSVIAGRDVVPRDELLAAVRERSPVYTHGEIVLSDKGPALRHTGLNDAYWEKADPGALPREQMPLPSRIGEGVAHGRSVYQEYGQGGDDYKEILLTQPSTDGSDYGNHWRNAGATGVDNAVAHLRLDTHRDALRINELQSDLGIHNRKMREGQGQMQLADLDGNPTGVSTDSSPLPFPLEDAWADILTKRAVLEAARQGNRAIEVASPRSIADKVGGNIDNYEHFYGKVVPGSLERLGRKMGGLTEDPGRSSMEGTFGSSSALDQFAREAKGASDATIWEMRRQAPSMGETNTQDVYRSLIGHFRNLDAVGMAPEKLDAASTHYYGNLYQMAVRDLTSGNMPLAKARKVAGEYTNKLISQAKAEGLLQAKGYVARTRPEFPLAGKRYTISDEMRKRIINEGIPAAVAIGVGTGIATGGSEAEASPLQSASDAMTRAALPWQTEQSIRRLKSQVDAAYARADKTQDPADFKLAENLDAKLEGQYEKWDSRLEAFDDGSEEDELDSRNYTEQMRDIYASYVSGRPGFRNEAELANALRGVGPDTATANQIPDEDLISEAKAAFDERQELLASVLSKSPEDGVRAMQSQLKGMPAGAIAAPIMAQAQSVNERRELPTGSGGTTQDLIRGMVGERDFSMSISPAEWQEQAQRLQADGMSMEQQKFQQNVTDVLGQPIIRVGAAKAASPMVEGDDFDRITPAQLVGKYLDYYKPRLDQEARGMVMDQVAARLSGVDQTPDPMVDDIVDSMMGALKESSPQGKYAKADPMPQEQFDALKQQYGDWAESMLTPGSAENFESLRGYELLRTTLDGQHAPVYADNLSNAMAFVSGFADGDSRRDFQELTFGPGLEGRFGRANRDYFRSRTQEGEPAAFRDQDGTSRFASTGMNNITGLMRAGGDMSTTVGAISHPLYDSFADFSRTNLGQFLGGQNVDPSDWEFQQSRRQAFDREQPILPAGMSRDVFDRQQQNHQKDRDEGLAWGATTYPNVQQFFDNATGSKTKKTWGPPAYNDYGPNFFQNTVGNIPSAGIMAASAATGGVAGLAAGAFKPAGSAVRSMVNAGMGLGRGAARGVGAAAASQAADLPFDTATDFGIGSTIAGPGNYFSYMTTPEQGDNALLPGVDPNSMSIEQLNQKRASALENRDERFLDDKFEWNKKRKTPQEQAYDQWRQNQ